MKTKTGDPISAFFLDHVSLAEATEIGWQYATEVKRQKEAQERRIRIRHSAV